MFYMVLKGNIQIQIPDPVGSGLIEPKIVKQEVQEEEVEVEEEKKDNLTKAEIDALPPKEQRRYKTRMMLSDILNSQNVARSTVSPGQAVSMASKIGSNLILNTHQTSLKSPFKIATTIESPKESNANPTTFITEKDVQMET